MRTAPSAEQAEVKRTVKSRGHEKITVPRTTTKHLDVIRNSSESDAAIATTDEATKRDRGIVRLGPIAIDRRNRNVTIRKKSASTATRTFLPFLVRKLFLCKQLLLHDHPDPTSRSHGKRMTIADLHAAISKVATTVIKNRCAR